LRTQTLLLACALALSWLGPHWHVPLKLVLLGGALLFSFAAAQLFAPEARGVRQRLRALVLLPLGALVFAGPWVPWRHEAAGPVLVEVFLPLRQAENQGATGSLALAGTARWASAVDEGLLLPILPDLRQPAARDRLGRLSGMGGPLPEESAARIDEPIVFLNGKPLSRLESPEDALAREMSRGSGAVEFSGSAHLEPGAIRLGVEAPPGATFEIFVLSRAEEAGADSGWWRLAEILQPASATAAAIPGSGASTERLRYDLEFIPGATRPEAGRSAVQLLVVSADAGVVGLKRIP
jgi:hypothetical protein